MVPAQSSVAQSSVALGVSALAISQSQFRAFCEKTSHPFPRQPWEDGDPAVVNVTWDEANDYARWLSNESGQRYRLPTESEWLHAARTLGARNGFTAGKVREWVEDEWIAEAGSAPAPAREPEQRVVRGASYADDSATVLSSRRNRPDAIRDALTGFRVVREAP
jgi:formylglycine-generating enzyme required for sulfatase activity